MVHNGSDLNGIYTKHIPIVLQITISLCHSIASNGYGRGTYMLVFVCDGNRFYFRSRLLFAEWIFHFHEATQSVAK